MCSASAGKESFSDRIASYARLAVDFLRELVLDERVEFAGCAWGGAVRSLTDGLTGAFGRSAPRAGRPIRWIPLRGDALELRSPLTASANAYDLSAALNGAPDNDMTMPRLWYSLIGVPPVLPASFIGRRRTVLKEYLGTLQDYKACYAGPQPLIEKVRLVITSCGPWPPVSSLSWNIFTEGGLEPSLPVYGDIAGIVLAKEDKFKKVDDFNENNLVGAKVTHLEAIVCDGHVVVVAFEDVNRADCIREAFRRGLANHLITDRLLAEAILSPRATH